jgi:hypothetical protein
MNNKSTYQYQNISSFGPEVKSLAINNPLSYCLSDGMDNSFMHGGYAGQMLNRKSVPCQSYISDYCSKNWDEYCEMESRNQSKMSNAINNKQNTLSKAVIGLTAGEVLIYNCAMKKYVIRREGNCEEVKNQFDPTVASSPTYSEWVSADSNCGSGGSCVSGGCLEVFGVDASKIDADPLMNKILDKPIIALDILKKIYTDMKRDEKIGTLAGTRIGAFFGKHFVALKKQ